MYDGQSIRGRLYQLDWIFRFGFIGRLNRSIQRTETISTTPNPPPTEGRDDDDTINSNSKRRANPGRPRRNRFLCDREHRCHGLPQRTSKL
ncbi:hypothetical protein RISK_002075 [Rhodopirellula islandica]|uniref:Uncharacterized protein n=1 Tax=Rhodopirellula islandica TaxID=595434 RepID=A0A0J1BFX2_RHOIS|nr:hypothetical protein RISK_002075 [Rhodopirellula islandica]